MPVPTSEAVAPAGAVSYGAVDSGAAEPTLDEEIARHYLSNLKYGLEGTDGSLRSNYKAYMSNHHPFFSIFFSSPKNPYHRLNKALTFWNSVSLMFFYSCLFPNAFSSLPTALLITVLMMPYAMLLDSLATCRAARQRPGCCLPWVRRCGSALLAVLAVVACSFIAAGVLVLKLEQRPVRKTVIIFCLSVLLSQLLPFVFGLTNWYVTSWSGVLCCPQCSCSAAGHSCSNEDYVCCPLLEVCPINFVLNMYCLGEPTFAEDRRRFQQMFPGRVAVDRFEAGRMPHYESGLLLQGSESCGANLETLGYEDHVETI